MVHRGNAGLWGLVILWMLVLPAAGAPPHEIKLQAGGQWLSSDTGLVPADVPGSAARAGGFLGGVSVLGCGMSRWGAGVAAAVEGNRVAVGPAYPATGAQVFGIATLRALAVVECRLRGGGAPSRATEPYAVAGLGWNWNAVGTKITWAGGAPAGAALDLRLDSAPAALLGFGVHQRIHQGSACLNAEFGWKLNSGDHRMSVAGSTERAGHFDLSGFYLLVGLTLRSEVSGSESR